MSEKRFDGKGSGVMKAAAPAAGFVTMEPLRPAWPRALLRVFFLPLTE